MAGGGDVPTAIGMMFGWVLAGNTNTEGSNTVVSHHVSVLTGDELLRQFCDLIEKSAANSTPTRKERTVINHFDAHLSRDSEAKFILPAPPPNDPHQSSWVSQDHKPYIQ